MDAVQLATAGDCQKSYDQLMAEWRYICSYGILIARERAYVQGLGTCGQKLTRNSGPG